MRFFLPLALTSLGIALVFYLSWLPQPKLGLTWFIPDWLATWADASSHDTIRTGVPFIFLGILTGAWLSFVERPWYSWLISWLTLILIVLFAEIGQLFLPNRTFDKADVGWGAAGALAGLAISFAIAFIRNFLKSWLKKRRRTKVLDSYN